MAEYGDWRASMDRTAVLPVGTIAWSGAGAGRAAGKKVAMPFAYRAIAMMLAVFLALRSKP